MEVHISLDKEDLKQDNARKNMQVKNIKIKHEKQGAVNLIHVDGRLDGMSAADFLDYLTLFIKKNKIEGEDFNMLLDFEKLEYISSAGIRVLLITQRTTLKNKGKLCICSLTENIQRLFKETSLNTRLKIYPNRVEALESISHYQ